MHILMWLKLLASADLLTMKSLGPNTIHISVLAHLKVIKILLYMRYALCVLLFARAALHCIQENAPSILDSLEGEESRHCTSERDFEGNMKLSVTCSSYQDDFHYRATQTLL